MNDRRPARHAATLAAALAAAIAILVAVAAGAGAAIAAGGPDGGGGGGATPTPTALVDDWRWVFQGFAPTWLVAARQARADDARRHVVSRELPALEFDALRAVMLADGAPVVSDRVRALEGRRVRVRGHALPLAELADARAFVLHDAPFIRCVHVATPATNRQVLVRLADGARFDFTDAPLVVEGVLRVGRFETFAEGDVALYALDDARYEVLPLSKQDMVIGFEHGPAAHEGEVHIPARRGGARRIDPGVHGH